MNQRLFAIAHVALIVELTSGVAAAGVAEYDRLGLLGGRTSSAKEPDAAKALIKFLSEPEAVRVIKDKGMELGAL